MAQVVARPLCYRVVLGPILGRVMPKDFKIGTSQPSVSTKGLGEIYCRAWGGIFQ